MAQGEPEAPASSQLRGELLVARRLASRQDSAKALAFQQQYGGRIGSILVRLGALSEESLLPVLSEQLGIDLLASGEWPEEAVAIGAAIEPSGLPLDWWLDNGIVAWRAGASRSEARRVGNEGVSTCRSRWSPSP